MRKKLKKVVLLLILSIFFIPLYGKAEESIFVSIQPPVIGESFQNMIWGSFSPDANISLELYNNTDHVVVLDNTSIKKNKDYTLSVRLNTFDNEPWDINKNVSIYDYSSSDYYVDKTDATITNDSYEFQIHYNTRQEKTKIYGSLRLSSFGKPSIGKNITYNEVNKTDSNKKYYTITQGWYEENSNTRLTEDDVFQANKTYEYHISLVPKEGYTFSDYINVDNYILRESGYYQYHENEMITDTNKKKEYILYYNTTQEENKIYGPVDLELPTINFSTGPKNIVSKDSRYTVSNEWYYYDDEYNRVVMEEGDSFEVGKHYNCNISIQANEGYSVADGLEITMSNFPESSNMSFYNYGYNSASLSISFSDLMVSDIYNANTYEARPQVGKKPEELRVYSYTNSEEAKYEIANQEWYVGSSKMSTNEVFAQNRNYKLVVTYQTKGDYEFSSNVQNNQIHFSSEFFTESHITNLTKKELTIEYSFKIEYKENYIYDNLDLNINAPEVGNIGQLATILTTDYTIAEQYWYNLTDHKKMTTSDTFEKDKIYEYYVSLEPKNNKKFSSEFAITSSKLEASPYLDKDGRMFEIDGGRGSTSGPMQMSYSRLFMLTDKLNDKNYLMGYVGLDQFFSSPKTSHNISYGKESDEEFFIKRYREVGVTIEKGWYEKGSDKILSENDTFKPNKSYEFHIRYLPLNSKKIISTLLTTFDNNYSSYIQSPYFKEEKRIEGDNDLEIVLSYDMGPTSYEEDTSIIKKVTIGEIKEQKANQTVQKTNPVNTETYTIVENWYERIRDEYSYEDNPLKDNQTLEVGREYLQRFTITPKKGYLFSDEVEFETQIEARNESCYCTYESETNTYECEVYHYNIGQIDSSIDSKSGFVKLKHHEYEIRNHVYRIPEGVDSLSLEVIDKSGEYDISAWYGENHDTMEYEIDNDIITFSNIIDFHKNNPTVRYYDFGINVDANDEYQSGYLHGEITFDEVLDSKTVTLPTITDYEGKEDGEAHSITVEGGKGGTIVYSLDGKTWQEELPQVSQSGITKIYVKMNPDEGYIALMPTYGYVKLYGESIPYEVRFHSNDENNQVKTQIMIKDENTKLDKNIFMRDGYTFEKWTTNSDGTGDSYEDEATINISNDLDLYAKWKNNVTGSLSLTANPDSIDYGEVRADFTKIISKKVKIKNTGDKNVSLTINNPTNVGPFGSQSFDNGKVLKPNEEYEATLIVNPNGTNHDKPGTYNGIYKIIGTDTKNSNNKFTLEIPAQVVINPLPLSVAYMTHVQDYGDQKYVRDGQMAGTSGQSKRLEAIRIKLENQPVDGDIEYRTHVEDYGWMSYVKNGAMSGTSHEAKRLEAIQIRLTGQIAEQYDVYYRVHAQDVGWMNWAKNDEMSGTAGYGRRLEGIEIVIVEKGQNPPTRTNTKTTKAFIQKQVLYTTHVEDYGWQSEVADGAMSGTSHQSKRLEGIKIRLYKPQYTGDIEYRTHVQDIGWQAPVKNGQMSGTSGQAKRLEAIEIQLTEEMAQHYDIYYRVHAEHFGWMNWAKNGQSAGTAHYGYRLEGIEIVIVDKGEAPPTRTDIKNSQPFVDKKEQNILK